MGFIRFTGFAGGSENTYFVGEDHPLPTTFAALNQSDVISAVARQDLISSPFYSTANGVGCSITKNASPGYYYVITDIAVSNNATAAVLTVTVGGSTIFQVKLSGAANIHYPFIMPIVGSGNQTIAAAITGGDADTYLNISGYTNAVG